MKIKFPPSLDLAHLPTPIQKIKGLPGMPNDFALYVKRDDLTGFALSGNKVRKLEFVLAEALEQKADCLITCGGEQSNHARATAVLATQLGLKPYLVLFAEGKPKLDGNLFLDKMVGAEIRYITEDDYFNRRDQIMQEIADDLKKKGHKPYLIPEGASNTLGTWGYVKAGQEIKKQINKDNLKIERIVLASSSGGTYAGLFISSKLLNWKVKVTGFNVNYDKNFIIGRIWKLLIETKKRFNLEFELDKDEIDVIDGYVGAGYAKTSDRECQLLKSIASHTGLILDPVYTGKAMFGLL
ncbi:MAG: D-cysteine desulfhydrase family protein, partial [candidate division Zixibacteria bacterium]|nr:D-cysteine desulfhydrase family protein [candidate division Zixibacteria bacterium]